MKINIDNIVSMTEANQNFSKVAQKVNKDGAVLIIKNNKPKYVVADYEAIEAIYKDQTPKEIEYEIANEEEVESVVNDVLAEYLPAFKKLAE